LFQDALDLAQVTQSSQKGWATTYINLGTCYRKLQKLEEARVAYQKVLELDSRHSVALGFLGLVYHLMGNLDKAIIKYHEALSVDPINPHILELLNTALESSVASPSPLVVDTEFKQAVRSLKIKYTSWQDKGKERAHADVLPSNNIGAVVSPDEMNIG